MKTDPQLSLDESIKLVSGKNFWETYEVPSKGVPSFKMSDGPHGLRTQDGEGDHLGLGTSARATCFPTASASACSFDTELLSEIGKAIGEEATCCGVGVVLGPGINIKRSPLCGRNFEYFSEDCYLAGKLAAAYVSGMQSVGVSSCLKHFACDGREFGRMAYNATVGERTLRELYLTAFEIAITQSHAGAVMTAYNKVNGQYCFGNTHLVWDILRGEWQYDGLVVSDWGGSYNLPAGLAAGSDLEMPACKFGSAEVRQALQNGTVSEEQIHTSAGHIVQMAQKCAAIQPVSYTPKAHDALAVRAAEKSCVLLKNSGILPLQPQSKVAVIGDFAFEPVIQGGGSSHVNCAQTANLIEALRQEDVQLVGAERGFCKSGKKKNTLAKKAVALAAQADTVIYCMGTGDHELEEGYDRTNIHLMPVQVQLLTRLQAVCSHIVVVLFCGDVVQTDWDNNVDAVLLAGYGGQGACRAVAHLLVGKANPCGKLAQSWYESMADIPHLSTYSPVFNKAEHAEGLEVGYRNQTAKIKYPFGYGLSYTTFAYSRLIVQEGGVTFTLKNTGNRDGYEVVQLYVGFPFYPSVPQLKGFARVFVKAGEEKQIELAFDNYTFRTYLNGWHIFAGEYTICVGGQFGNFPLQTTVQRGGETPSKQQLAALNTPETPVENTAQTAEPTDCYSHLYKKVKVSPTLPFRQLKHAKGFSAKLMYFFMWLATLSKNKVERKSMEYLPIRSIMQFAPFSENQAQGFMMMLNGKFFRGLARLIKNDKNDKKGG